MEIHALPDEDLAVFVRTGSSESYDLLVKRYEDLVFNYIKGLVVSEVAANVLAQETFLKTYARLNDFKSSAKFSSFLYRIATIVSFHYIKKNNNSQNLGEHETFDEELTSAPDMLSEFRDPKLLSNINRYLLKTPIIYRAPLLLHFWIGQSYEDISEILLLPVSTIISRIDKGVDLIEKYAKKHK